ncbi:MAG: choice-of-anchor Q domain-containing protein [Casimicrobium sp.]
MTTRTATRLSALTTFLLAFALTTSASAATITVNSLLDDVYVNATEQIFLDAAYTAPVVLTSAKCTLRMAIAAANTDTAIGGSTFGCAAGSSGADTITIGVSGTIKLSQVAMEPRPFATGGLYTWLLFSAGNVTINGTGSGSLTINGGGLSSGAVGLRAMVISNNDPATDAPTTITGVSFKEGRSVASLAALGGASGGCVFSRESLTLTNVVFDSCEAAGSGDGGTSNATNFSVTGGALTMGAQAVTDFRPNATLSNVRFLSNRTVHGTAGPTFTSAGGAATFGNGNNLWVGAVSISGSQFFGNTSEAIGALRVTGATSVSISSTQFVSNSATVGNDGAFLINNVSGTVTLNGGGVVGNSAVLGRRGGGQISTVGSAVASGDAVTVNNFSFIGNAAGVDIGGLSILTDTFDNVTSECQFLQLRNVSMSNVYFQKNIANKSRAGLRVGCSGNLALSNAQFEGNEVNGTNLADSGGTSALLLHDLATVTLSDIEVTGNKTYAGTIAGGYAVVSVVGGPSSASVPAVYPLAHSFSATRLTVKDNFVERNEAGLSLRANGAGRNYLVEDSSFIGNRAQSNVALLLDATGNYTVRNSTFSANESTNGTGSIVSVNLHAASSSNTFNLVNNTLARNFIGTGSVINAVAFVPGGVATALGGPLNTNGNVVIRNSIVAMWTPGSLSGNSIFAPSTPGFNYAVSYSLFEPVFAPNSFCTGTGMKCGVDAKIEGLQLKTHALRAGSPALDAGDNTGATAFDQRGTGNPRIVNGTIDMGAFESPVLAAVLACKLDMNNDGFVRANQEGLVLLRSMLGFSGPSVVAGTGISQFDWDAARNNLNTNCGTSLTP